MKLRSPSNYALEGPTTARSGRLIGRILIVDDEPSMRRVLHTTLLGLGFEIGEAASGEEAVAICQISKYDAVLLDMNMPGMGGIATCVELRKTMTERLPILMLTVTDDHERIVEALEAGADDYITKPFHMRELTARIRAALRRSRTTVADCEDVIVVGDLRLYPARRLVQKAGCAINLTPKEFDLLLYLMTHPGIPITHARLLAAVWGTQHSTRMDYLRTFMRLLRQKLEDDSDKPKYLFTVNRIGYRFADPAEIV